MSITLPNGRTALHWFGLLVVVVIVVPFVVYAVPGVVGAEGGYVVLSGSMEPSISTGDVVIVDSVNPNSIEEGDVITYRRSGAETPTTHRVVEITDQGDERAFVTRGDANDQPDASPVPASQVIGTVIFTIPYMGYVIEFANTPVGLVALVAVPLLLLVAIEIRSVLSGGGSNTNDGSETATETDGELADPEETRPDDTSNDTIALTRSDLRLSLGVLCGTAIYAGWVAYNIQEAWSFAAVFGSTIGVLLTGGMYYTAGTGDPDESESNTTEVDDGAQKGSAPEGGSGARRIVDGSLSMERRKSDRVTVDSLQTLISMATAEREWVVADSEAGGYYLCREGVVYEFPSETVSANLAGREDTNEGDEGGSSEPDETDPSGRDLEPNPESQIHDPPAPSDADILGDGGNGRTNIEEDSGEDQTSTVEDNE